MYEMFRMEGIYVLLTCAEVSFLLCCAPLAHGDGCLRGFSEELPPREKWANFSTTVLYDGGSNDRNYLFPSLRFTCNGTLEELTFPIELRGSASPHWDSIINIGITVWRPTRRTGYTEMRDSEITSTLVTSQTEHIVTLARTEVLQFNRTLTVAAKIQANDVIALTYRGRDTRNDIEVARHCPFLFQEEPSSVILEALRDPSFMPLGSDFFLPIIVANFTPDSAQETSTGTSSDAKLTPETATDNSSDAEASTSPLDGPFVAAGITAAAVQLEVLLAILVTAVIVWRCKGRAARNNASGFNKNSTIPNTRIDPTQTNLPADPSGHGVHEYESVSMQFQTEYPYTHNGGNGQNVNIEEDTPIEEYYDTYNSPNTESAAYYYI